MSLFSMGVAIGVALAELRQEPVASAQSGWQCRLWTLDSTQTLDAVGSWLGTAARVEISTTGIEGAGRYVLAACKQ